MSQVYGAGPARDDAESAVQVRFLFRYYGIVFSLRPIADFL